MTDILIVGATAERSLVDLLIRGGFQVRTTASALEAMHLIEQAEPT